MAYARRPNAEGSTTSLISPSSGGAHQWSGSGSGQQSRESWAGETPYSAASSSSRIPSMSEKFSLSADPQLWGSNVSPNVPEADDEQYLPTVRNGKVVDDSDGMSCSGRGLANVGCLAILCLAVLMLFLGYPILSYVQDNLTSTTTANLGVNSTGQVPSMGNFGLIDLDTPSSAYTKKSLRDGSDMVLVFSDEFEQEGRSFYPGEDPYWEAVDLHYWSTNNLEWYSPLGVTTTNGSLKITLSEKEINGLDYQGGMLSTWNKFCFTGGYFEVSVVLPGASNVQGLWPAVWTMGNLGRAGYGATLDGMWPYTYDACDVGTVANQTIDGQPTIATTSGGSSSNYELSYLTGQRLSRCTCDGESHPGPKHSDGTYVGRAAPEIDLFEAQVSDEIGHVSQSGQWAPFNAYYLWDNTTDNFVIADADITALNTYFGGDYQQSTSAVSQTDQDCYQYGTGCFSTYGFEYKAGYEADDAYISWVNNGVLAWTVNAAGVGADSDTEISARPVPQEPMYLLANLGMSYNFGSIDLDDMVFPVHMLIDYVRVYQDANSINIGCDPVDFPTAEYIAAYNEAYQNPNITTWVDSYGQTIPKNSLVDDC